jgi:lysophospholipase L1-like esterase
MMVMRVFEMVAAACVLCLACNGSDADTKGAGGSGHAAQGGTSSDNGGSSSATGSGGKANGGSTGAGAANGGTSASAGKSGSATGGSATAGNAAGGMGGKATAGTGGSAGSEPFEPSGGAADWEPCPPEGTACVIMPLGDSITYGDHGDNTTDGGYRPQLFHRALADNKSITFIGDGMNGPAMVDGVPFPPQHDGHPGFTIAGGPAPGIAEFAANHLDMYKPQIVTLMIGTNDVNLKYELATAPDRLGALIDLIVATRPYALLVVAQISPSKYSDEFDANAAAYNAAIPAVVKARVDQGKHVLLVDMDAAFRSNPNYKDEYINDILHPKTAGYNKMGDVWYEALSPYLH